MAEDCTDGDYLGSYSRFFAEFVARVNPHDQLPVSVSAYNVTEGEIVGEIISVTLQYLNQTHCPPSLQAHLVHQVIQEINTMCKKQAEDCGFKTQDRTFASLKLMQAITGKVNEICTRYLDNSRLALLPPPPSMPLPQVIAGGSKNCRRKMEDRYVVLHDLHTMFGIQDDSIANYYAVFDGHAGRDAAVYCATHLHQYLAESIYYPTNPERALHDAFLTTDAQFIEKSKTQKVCGGTTAVCTLLLNKKLYVAWVGDSTATLVRRGYITQLVDPHRLSRNDEVQRIRKMGGEVFQSMGIPRVNGVLGVSRAIGDVQYKPYVTGEPEIKCVPLDGTEDFLVISSDGLTDVLDPRQISTMLYHEICRRPNALKYAHQTLLQWAKHEGSEDNITVVVVLLTPASEIAARQNAPHPFYCLKLDDTLDKMNSKDKPLLLDTDERHDALNPSILKHTMFSLEPQDQDVDDILTSSNGKHENGDADYDYSDLGPETDVDAIDDVATVPVKNLSYEYYRENDDDSSHDEEQVEKDGHIDNNKIDVENDMVMDHDVDSDHEELHVDNNLHGDETCNNENVDIDEKVPVKDDARVDDVDVDDLRDVVDDAGPVDYDDSPPSPQATKPLQHALISEADNVADSEDSEDEWNYYRVDPNKEKDSTTPVNEPQENQDKEEVHSQELLVEDTKLEIQSQEIEEDIKCESPKKEVSSELIDTEISAEDEVVRHKEEEEAFAEDKEELKNMDFQLNPDAAEFIPVSPQILGTRLNLVDFPISGSPLKQVSQMDDIQVPSQSEFEEEVCRRPREVEAEEKECTNGDHLQERTDYTDFMMEGSKSMNIGIPTNLDDSEISSTKAEFGDESSSFLTASEFHRTGISTVDESFSSSERDYDIAKDPMAMSFTPSDFDAAFVKGVDLNAVHDLSCVDLDEKNGTVEEEGVEVQFQDLHPELSTLASPDTEQPTHTTAFPDVESSELVNISSQQEDSESTFIEHAEQQPKTVDFLDIEPEHQSSQFEQSSPVEHQDVSKSDRSPMTDNYSVEFESEKEVLSADRGQSSPLSSPDIDETKPIDETSADAVLPTIDSQKDVCTKEADSTSSLSPVPDMMECTSPQKEDELICSMENLEISPVPVASSLHSDVPEFKPRQYDFTLPSESVSDDMCALTLQDNVDKNVELASAEESNEAVLELVTSTDTMEEIQEHIQEDVKKDEKEIVEEAEIHAPELTQMHIQEEVKMEVQEESQKEAQEEIQIDVQEETQKQVQEEMQQQVQEETQKQVQEEMQHQVQEEMQQQVQEEMQKQVEEESQEQIQEETQIKLQEETHIQAQEETQIQLQEETHTQAQEESDIQLQEEASMQAQEESDIQLQEETTHIQAQEESDMQLQEEITHIQAQEEPVIQLQEETHMQAPDELEAQEVIHKEIQMQVEENVQMQGEEKETQPQEKVQALDQEEEIQAQEQRQEKFEDEVQQKEVQEQVEGNLLNFVEERDNYTKSPVEKTEIEPTPLLSLQQTSEKPSEDINNLICPIEPVTKLVDDTIIVKLEEDITKLDICQVETQKEVAHVDVHEPEATKDTITLNLSESMQEFTGLEKQLLPEDVAPVKNILEETEQQITAVDESKAIVDQKESPEVEVKEVAEDLAEKESVQAPVESKEPEVQKSETSEKKIDVETVPVVAVAAATVTAAAAVAAGAAAATQPKPKAKPAIKSAKTTTQAKATPKSTPTSPSKTTSTSRTATATAAKKPPTSATARPKDLDASKKSTVSSTASKVSASKPPSAAKAATTTTSKTTTRTSAGLLKAKPTTASPKSTLSATDKKPTANGDVKSLSKPAAAKTLSKPAATGTATKTSAVKSSSTTRTTASSTTTKPRPTSAATTTKTTVKSATTATTTNAATTARPKSVPATTSNAAKPRTSTAKSPMIDKQIKETANKQISLARTSTSSASKTTRTSTSATTTTASTVKRTSTTKLTTMSSSPIKKATPTKVSATRSATGSKTVSSSGKVKVVQNGVSESMKLTNTILTTTNSKLEDDVPKKDLSPVVAPTDNQLIMSSD